jgi:ribonuclease HI
MVLQIYTDGSFWESCGGWAAVFVAKKDNHQVVKFIGGWEDYTTNNRMEILPMIKLLETLQKSRVSFTSINVYSDSQYTINTINGWLDKWIRKNDTSNKKNMDLWLRFYQLRQECKYQVRYHWVKGHNGNYFNEMADKLAGEARRNKLTTGRLTEC